MHQVISLCQYLFHNILPHVLTYALIHLLIIPFGSVDWHVEIAVIVIVVGSVIGTGALLIDIGIRPNVMSSVPVMNRDF
jgi:hypothetical protein